MKRKPFIRHGLKALSGRNTRKILLGAMAFLLGGLPMFGAARMLIIGDSHINGWYGAHLHRFLHESIAAEWMSIGIGGAGSIHYTLQLKNFCCGYVVRHSHPEDSLSANKLPQKVETGRQADQQPILKKYSARLDSIIASFQPMAVLISLGSNQANNHEGLLRLIQQQKPDAFILWIGPFRRMHLMPRIQAIQRAIKRYPRVRFVPTHDLAGHDTLTMFHFHGKKAERVARSVSERIVPILDSLVQSRATGGFSGMKAIPEGYFANPTETEPAE